MSNRLPKRLRMLAALVLASACLSTAASAQEAPFPNRPITLIVPFPPGGAADGHLRTTAELVSKQLGQSVVVVNRPGASGTLGPTTMAKSARPDGYTISQMSTSAYRLPFTQKVDWDPLADFSFIVNMADVPYGVLVSADSPWNSLADVVKAARENPGKVTFGTSGQITVPHLAMEELGLKTGAKMTLVPFKGYADGVTALVGKHIDVLVESPSWEQMVATKRLKLLALTGNQRSAQWPDVPTLKELYGVVGIGPYGIVGPRGMDPKVVKTLHDAFRAAMDDPAYKASMDKFRQQSAYLNSQDYHDWAVRYSAEQKALLDKLGLSTR